MKQLLLIAAATALLFAQQSGTKLPSCGLGMNKDHPCKCMNHTQEVQEQHMRDCIRAAMESGDGPGKAALACAGSMPPHCSVAEHYGHWEVGEDGEHKAPMPQQCTSACLRRHCMCDDGPTCHFGHQPQEDDGLPPVYPGQEEENQ